MIGFSQENASQQSALEKKFDSFINRDNPRTWLQRLSAHPHHVGSAYGLKNAEFMRDLFKSWGYDAQIEEFRVLFPTPKERLLELLSPHKFTAKIIEPELKEDASSKYFDEELPPYNAYSADGDVTGKLVYANFGMPKDYEVLESKGISVKGKIVLTRYGGGWRGLKPKLAAEHGAIGCLIYSDPHEDGYFQEEVYPKGPMRNENGVQRGSVADMPIMAGDALTPGYGAVPGAKQIPLSQATTIMKIPVMPISYGDALPLLKDLNGEVVPSDWRGALPITYHFGPSESDCHLKLKFNWDTVSCRDVIAKMPGSELPDEWIIRGNHHDGWVTGAQDPLSGTVALLEEARSMAELAKTGWKPKRTLVYCCWDGEEPGLLGSTEWVETHAEELSRKAAVYINSDETGRGYLGMGGSHSLEVFINQVAKSVEDPEKKISVWERSRDNKIVGASTDERKKLRSSKTMDIGALGSGSDFTPFLQHLGIASLDLGYGGESPAGVYHSAYDSFDWYTRFDDTTFEYSNALSKTAGHAVMRLANADVLPFEFSHLADKISGYVTELIKLTDRMREETLDVNAMIADGTYTASYDPHKTNILPKAKEEVPHLNFAPLENAVERLKKAADLYKANGAKTNSELDSALIATERSMLSAEGLPKRPWFKHMVYAPGLYTGYGVKTLPSVREAIEEREWRNAEAQIPVVAATLDKLSDAIRKAAELAQGK